MADNAFHQTILDTLQGQTDQLRTIPPERLDWAGPGAFLQLYRQTSGSDRTALIRAVGEILDEHSAPTPVLAQLVQFASALELAEVEPQIRRLQAEAIAAQEPLQDAITNYLPFRQLTDPPTTVPTPPPHNTHHPTP